MDTGRPWSGRCARVAALLAALALNAPASALRLQLENIRGTLDSEISAGAMVRAEERDPSRVGLANGGLAYSTNTDDGNQAFDRGDVVSSVSKLTSDLTVRVGRFGLFARGNYFYNPTLRQADALFDASDYVAAAGRELGLGELTRKRAAVRDTAGEDAELLDAYLFGGGTVMDRAFAFRVGRQTVSWGESLLMDGGLDSLRALDLNRLHLPGAEFAEVQVPAGTALLTFAPVRHVQIEAFYQYEWRPSVLDAAGTFLSTRDFLGAGGTQLNLGYGRVDENTAAGVVLRPATAGLPCIVPAVPVPVDPSLDCVPGGSTIPRLPDVGARDQGQYGASVEVSNPGHDVSVKLHAANYHSRMPVLSLLSADIPPLGLPAIADTAGYFAEYPEDIAVYGAGINLPVRVLDAALHLEYSFRRGQPLEIDEVELLLAALGQASQVESLAGATLGGLYLPGWRRHEVSQWSVGASRAFAPMLGADLVEIRTEAGGVHVHDLPPPGLLRYRGPATHVPGDPVTAALESLPLQRDGHATASSWGYAIEVRPTWFDAIGPLDLESGLRFEHDVSGITPAPLSNFVGGRRLGSALLGLSYLQAWSLELGYTAYFGGGPNNLLSDRDHYEISLKRWF